MSEKSDDEVVKNLSLMASWNSAQTELRAIANGDMLKFPKNFGEWLLRHWELTPQCEESKKMADEIHSLRNQLTAARLELQRRNR